MHAASSLDRAYFRDVYAASDDPWQFATSEYEAEKYARTLAMLGDVRFARALEIGCSIGVFTAQLAPRCDDLLSLDVSDVALQAARLRCAALPQVRFENRVVPPEFPFGSFDYILLSEVGYYWSNADLRAAIEHMAQAASGGTVELVHYLPDVRDYPGDGDSVHTAFRADDRFSVVREYCGDRYRIDVLAVR